MSEDGKTCRIPRESTDACQAQRQLELHVGCSTLCVIRKKAKFPNSNCFIQPQFGKSPFSQFYVVFLNRLFRNSVTKFGTIPREVPGNRGDVNIHLL